MKKFLATLLSLIIFTTASAEFRWGPTAGINLSNFHFKQELISSTRLVGPNVGIMGEMMFPGIGFGVDFGLRYQMHGATVGFGEKEVWTSTGIETQNVWIHALQIPLNLRFKYTNLAGLERIVAPFVYGGPVFSISLAHNKCAALDYSSGQIGMQCGIGGEFFEKLQVSAGYCWGLSYEIRTIKLDNFSARPEGWQINVTWLF